VPTKKDTSSKTNKYSHNGIFILCTAIAVAGSVLLIVLGRVSAHPAEIVTPPPTTTVSTKTTSTVTPVTTLTTSTTTAATSTNIPTSTTTVIPSLEQLTSRGSPSAPVTIIEYSDFQCARCQQFALTVEKQLEAAYIETGKVRLTYKFVNGWGDESLHANEAAACAAEQGKFWEYYFLLMEQRFSSSKEDVTAEKLQSLAQQLGLDMNKFNASLLSGKYEAQIRQQDAECRALGVTGTPTFFINGMKKAGAENLQDLQNVIDPILEGK
jgi:protein-disulfide isomerase